MRLELRHLDDGFGLKGETTERTIIPAVIGRSGLIAAADKREGDGATPRGIWPLREVMFRPDRIKNPQSELDLRPLAPGDGWCDDPAAETYNQRVDLPFADSHEMLWRQDHAYDIIIPLGYNDAPAIAGRGSAIFFHCREDGRNHTDGCVAISLADMLALLPHLTKDSVMVIDP